MSDEPSEVVRAMCMTAVLVAWVGPVCGAECARQALGIIRLGEDPADVLRQLITHRTINHETHGHRWQAIGPYTGRELAARAAEAWATGTVPT